MNWIPDNVPDAVIGVACIGSAGIILFCALLFRRWAREEVEQHRRQRNRQEFHTLNLRNRQP